MSNKPFPAFSLVDQDGKTWTNQDLIGRPTVIYFYPKDDTPGCTKEACDFRDNLQGLGNAQVLGVSPDPVKSKAKFASKHSLNFPLLADTEKALCEALGVWVEKSMYGRTYMGVERSTYLLDREGNIAREWRNVKVPGHVAEVARAVAELG
ncbi:MAG: peroxiredoxin [Chthonomonas sp.]|nr:peroxiredoxin [Chthonomonas sp.]